MKIIKKGQTAFSTLKGRCGDPAIMEAVGRTVSSSIQKKKRRLTRVIFTRPWELTTTVVRSLVASGSIGGSKVNTESVVILFQCETEHRSVLPRDCRITGRMMV